MTTATKSDPKESLSQLVNTKSSGCLKLSTESVSWKIYLKEGYLQYVYCSIQTLDRLKYHLHSLELKEVIVTLETLPQSIINIQNPSSAQNVYSKVITWLLTNKIINSSQSSKLIQSINLDDLISCLWLEQCVSEWQPEQSLPLWIPAQIKPFLSSNLAKYLTTQNKILNQWQHCSPKLISIHQRPYFAPGWERVELPASGTLNRSNLSELTKVLQGRTSIRQLSILLKKDEFQVAKILSPYIDSKIIYLHHPVAPLNKLPNIPHLTSNVAEDSTSSINQKLSSISHNNPQTSVKTWKIVCIDDSPTILSEIQRFLSPSKFQVTTIDDPIQAVSKIFNINPDLILLDITMPKINGYKLCGLLRSSGKCDHTPIIMVTGNTGLIDKARAKLAGATDYFTKPFTKEGLNNIVSKYLPS